jgi:UDP-N-acetylmuramyl pentapeptide phosphotransferase/UDP-N-acetylglucosamine-1-phosphate transferase
VVLAWFAAGAVAALGIWSLLRESFAVPVFTRQNVRGRDVPTGAGVVILIGALAVEATARLAVAAGLDLGTGTSEGRHLAVLLGLGMTLLGLLDDLGGVGQSGGFRGHLTELARGRLTTGAVKLFGGAAVALAVVSVVEPGALGRLLADSALVALAANLANLLDRAPGRVTKAALVAFVLLAGATRLPPELAGVALIVGGAAGLLAADLRERLMLGDAGANALGAALGLGVVLTASPAARTAVLIAVVALNLASEVVSFSRIIDGVAPLRAHDRLGRAR